MVKQREQEGKTQLDRALAREQKLRTELRTGRTKIEELARRIIDLEDRVQE
jgi:uncharacterized protein YlxW (UPF0749 family)